MIEELSTIGGRNRVKTYVIAAALCLMFGSTCHAQQNPSDSPATREEIVRYLDTIHMRSILQSAIDLMSKETLRQTHDYIVKYPSLPSDAEARLDKIVTDNLATLHVETLIDAMIPVYQKHLTSGDLDALMAFYATAHGKRILEEFPAATDDGMQARTKVLQATVDSIRHQMMDEIVQMQREQANKMPAQ
jgi:hypothetical protein